MGQLALILWRSVFIKGLPDAFSMYLNRKVRVDRLLYRQASPVPWTHLLRQRFMLLQAVDPLHALQDSHLNCILHLS